MDLYGPYPNGQHIIVVMDEYSRYPVVETLTTVSTKTVIPLLDKIFSIFGRPSVLKTDNGPPFNGNEFRQFAEHMGFKHRLIEKSFSPKLTDYFIRGVRNLFLRSTGARGTDLPPPFF
jgi:transposase InsO family protein